MDNWVKAEVEAVQREFEGNGTLAEFKTESVSLDYGSFSFILPGVKAEDDDEDDRFIAEVTQSGYRIVEGPIAVNPNTWYPTFHIMLINLPKFGKAYGESFFAKVNSALGKLIQGQGKGQEDEE